MKIRILGAGFYGCHLALALLQRGHNVEIHEIADRIFTGASGTCPARIHQGQHYPRSYLTRKHCREHNEKFLEAYGHLTRGVPVNIYAVAAHDSLVDFGNYVQVLKDEIDFIRVFSPSEYGLANVEGAILTGERHIIVREVCDWFEEKLDGHIEYNTQTRDLDSPDWDWTIDCTFCANSDAGIDRYEPCITALLKGPTDRAVTIMDGPFPSLYPWDEDAGLSSLTSAKFTPLARCKTWWEARNVLNDLSTPDALKRCDDMFEQMLHFWPKAIEKYRVASYKTGIRAMPRSGADARLVDITPMGDRSLCIRAGKIDAVLHAEKLVCNIIGA